MKKVRKVTSRQKSVLGEFGELCFATKAASLGFAVMKPHGSSLPYDYVVGTGTRLMRVQVKTAASVNRRGYYHFRSTRANRRAYAASEVEFLVAYVVPEDAWYVIPVHALKRRPTLDLYPHRATSGGGYEKYREAWHLLAPKPLIRRIFAQADTAYDQEAPWGAVVDEIQACASAGQPRPLP